MYSQTDITTAVQEADALSDMNAAGAQLGFGCSMLMARLNRHQSLQLLDAAFESGITHFDTARLYGYGEAEGVLGEFVSRVGRSRLTITTKVGILPPRRSPVLSLAKNVARRLVAVSPKLRAQFRRKAESMVQARQFDIPTVRLSFETSLRELRTDYVDYLLLHECREEDLDSPELVRFLEDCQKQGKVRQFGIATTIEHTVDAISQHPSFTKVVQFPNSLLDKNIKRLSDPDGHRVFTHSGLGSAYRKLLELLSADPSLAKRWSDRLGADCTDASTLANLMLRYALTVNPRGVVLFSSTTETNIRSNAVLASDPLLSPEQVETLEALADSLLEDNR